VGSDPPPLPDFSARTQWEKEAGVIGPAAAAAKLCLFYNEGRSQRVKQMAAQAEAVALLRPEDTTLADIELKRAESK
jgi:hypothetical protein